MSAFEEYMAQTRGFQLEKATTEQLKKRITDLESINMSLNQDLYMFKHRYAQFEALYKENEHLTGAIENQKTLYTDVIAAMSKSK